MSALRRLLIEPYCILCRHSLNVGQKDLIPSWESDVLCLFSSEPPEELHTLKYPVVTFRADLSRHDWFEVGYEKDSSRLFTCSVGAGYPLDTINFCHILCLQWFQQRLGKTPSGSFLRQLSCQLRPMVRWETAQKLFDMRTEPGVPTELCASTDLGILLYRMSSKLPLELRRMVLSFVGGQCRSIFDSSSTLDFCKRQRDIPEAFRGSVSTGLSTTSEKIHRLGLEFVDILGERCLAHIRPLSDSDSCPEKAIDIDSARGVKSVQVAFGVYAVVDLQIVYKDGSTSGWTGTRRNRWFLNLMGEDLSQLSTTSDGTKIVRVALPRQDPSTEKLLWNDDRLPQYSTRSVLLDFYDPGGDLLSKPGYRLAKHLPLEGIRSLTMFVKRDGIDCIQADDDRATRLGSPLGSRPVTYYMRPGESVQSLHVLTQGSDPKPWFVGPVIVALTTSGRSLYYGFHYFPSHPLTNTSNFETPKGIRIESLFMRAASLRRSHLNSLGVTYAVQSEADEPDLGYFTLPSPTQYSFRSFFHRISLDVVFSSANFTSVRSMETQKIGTRCVGLKITRDNGTIDVLGQWDPGNHSAVSSLYETWREGPLKTLTFILCDAPESPSMREEEVFMMDIMLGDLSDAGSNCFVMNQLDLEMAWFWTRDFDHLKFQVRADSMVDIPRTSVVRPFAVS